MKRICMVGSLILCAGAMIVQAQVCGDPDPSVLLVQDAAVYDVDGGDMITVIDPWFEDDSLIGYYLAIRRHEDTQIEYFRIIGNEHFDQWNISVFSVAEDLEAGGDWWFYSCCQNFDIVGATEDGPNPDDPTFNGAITKVFKTNRLRHVSSTVSIPNGSQVGQWIGVTPVSGQPDQFFLIVKNTTRVNKKGKHVNTFWVDGDVLGAGAPNWWKQAGQDQFTIYEPCN